MSPKFENPNKPLPTAEERQKFIDSQFVDDERQKIIDDESKKLGVEHARDYGNIKAEDLPTQQKSVEELLKEREGQLTTSEQRQKLIDDAGLEYGADHNNTKPDLSTPEGRQREINQSGVEYARDYNNVQTKPDLTTPEGKQQQIKNEGVEYARDYGNIKAEDLPSASTAETAETTPEAVGTIPEVMPSAPEAAQESGPMTMGELADERTAKLRGWGRKLWERIKYISVIDQAAIAGAKKMGSAGAELASNTVNKMESGVDFVIDKSAEKLNNLKERGIRAKDSFFGRIRSAKNNFFNSCNNMRLRALDGMLSVRQGVNEVRSDYRENKLARAREKYQSAQRALERTKQRREEIARKLGRSWSEASYEGTVAAAAA